MKLSFCIITKNEIKDLKRCINSIRSLAYEIIVVDTGSTDGTIKKLRALNDSAIKIFEFEWCYNFSKARNYSLSKATGDYIIVIDSDEWISEEEKIKIPIALSHKKDVYYVKQASNRKDGLASYVRNARIFKNNLGIQYRNAIHESIEPYAIANKLDSCTVDICFEHTGYDLTVEQFQKKLERNLNIHLQQKIDEPDNQDVNHFLANCYFALKNYSLAMEYCSMSLICNDMPLLFKAGACNLMFNILKAVNRLESGIEFLKQSIKLVPIQIEGRWQLANSLYLLEKYDLCLLELEQIKKIRNEYKETHLNNDRILTLEEIEEKINLVSELLTYKETA